MGSQTLSIKFFALAILIFVVNSGAFSQPYYYYAKNNPWGYQIHRINLQNGSDELFMPDSLNEGKVKWDRTQTWIYLDHSHNRGMTGTVEVVNTTNSNIRHEFPFEGSKDDVEGILYIPQKNSFYITWDQISITGDQVEGKIKSYIYNASTFAIVDSVSPELPVFRNDDILSDDESIKYYSHLDETLAERFVQGLSLNSLSVISSKREMEIGEPSTYKVWEGGARGKILIGYGYPPDDTHDKFVVYDANKGITSPIISVPSIVDAKLSADGNYVIIEETPLRTDTDINYHGDSHAHPGKFWVYEAATGKLVQQLSLSPGTTILTFDNYPNMIYCYNNAVKQSVNIDLTKFTPPSGCNVKLVSSAGTKLTGGTLQYYEGSWKDAINNNDGTFSINSTAKTLSLRMTYEYGTQTKSNVSISNDTIVFQTVNAQVQLQNSSGVFIDTGSVQYYAGAWRTLGTTINGTAAKELLPANYSFRMTYAYASKDKQQDIGTNATVVFQTANAVVQLQNSQGNLIDQGTVQYYSGAWRDLGTTTNGVATKELLPNNYSFRMTYAFASKDKQQDIGTNATVVFQTVNAAVQLQNSQGALMDQGTVQYYSGAWRDLGTTTNGVANKELLPNSYSFRMNYAFASKDKQQDISTNATVVFQTVNAAVQLKNSLGNLIDQGTVQYYSGAWRTLGTTTNGIAAKELLPNNYSFRMTYEYVSFDKSQDISTNNTVSFSTVLCTIRVKNSQNQLMDNALASYYSGAWRQIGNTVSGVITKELLPVNLSFRIKYGTQQQDKQQNLSTNNLVEFVVQ